MKTDIKAIITGTCYLLAYCILLQYEATRDFAILLFLLSPLLLVWMVLTVLRYGKYTGPDLDENEFGYADKDKDDLGIF